MDKSRITFFLAGLINFVFSLITIGLILRFVFKLIGASSSAGFTKFLYESTAQLLTPFNGIFAPVVIEKGYIFEFSTLIAVVIYALIAWLLVEFVTYTIPNLLRERPATAV